MTGKNKGRNRFAETPLVDEPGGTPDARATPAAETGQGKKRLKEAERTLSGRVPNSIFREFSRHRSDAEDVLEVQKVTVEQGLEALVRILRRPEVRSAWQEEVQAVQNGG